MRKLGLIAALFLSACSSKIDGPLYSRGLLQQNDGHQVVLYKRPYSVSVPRNLDIAISGHQTCSLPDGGFTVLHISQPTDITLSMWDYGSASFHLAPPNGTRYLRAEYYKPGAAEYGAASFGLLGAIAGSAIASEASGVSGPFNLQETDKTIAEAELVNMRKVSCPH